MVAQASACATILANPTARNVKAPEGLKSRRRSRRALGPAQVRVKAEIFAREEFRQQEYLERMACEMFDDVIDGREFRAVIALNAEGLE